MRASVTAFRSRRSSAVSDVEQDGCGSTGVYAFDGLGDGCPRFLSFQVEKHDAVVVKAAISFRVGPPVLNRVEVVDDVRFVVLRRQMVQYIDVENGIEQEAECQRNARSGKGA